MQLTPQQMSALKVWMLRRLRHFHDLVEVDILIDFIFNLLESDTSMKNLRMKVCQNLDDILEHHSKSFVRDLFYKLRRLTKRSNTMSSRRSVNLHASIEQPGSRRAAASDSNTEPPITPQRAPRSMRSASTPRRSRISSEAGRRHTMSHPVEAERQLTQDTIPLEAPQQALHQQNPFLNFPTDPYDPTLPMRVASFRAMQHHFPYLTQMWVNNLKSRGQEMPDWLFDDHCDVTSLSKEQLAMVGDSAKIMSEGVSAQAQRQMKCHDYDLTGMCIRGDACPYKHGMTISQSDSHRMLPWPSASTTDHNSKVDKSTNLPRAATSDANFETETDTTTDENLLTQRIRARQSYYQAEHDAKKREAGEVAERRVELAKRTEEVDKRLTREREALVSKMASLNEAKKVLADNGKD